MNRSLLNIALAASLLVVANVATAIEFRQVKGQKEFTGELIVRPIVRAFGPQATATYVQSTTLIQANILRYSSRYDYYIVRVPKGKSESSYATELLATGLYEYIHPNYRVFPLFTPNDPSLGLQWHHAVMQSELAWDITQGDPNLIYSCSDTGVFTAHTDFSNKIVSGFNAVSRLPQALGGAINDLHGHGTHVAGCSAELGNNGIFGSGPASKVRIMPVRVSDLTNGNASFEDIQAGLGWAAENGAKVVSASYSGIDEPSNETAGTYIRSLGSVMLYAAGNDNRNLSGFDHPNVIVVGASNEGDNKSSFSAFGRGVDIFAPGSNIRSTLRNGGFGAMSGTSMATPVAAGVLCLIFSVNPDLTPDQAEKILALSCQDWGGLGEDDANGWGRINANRAVRLAKVGSMAYDSSSQTYYEFVDANLNYPYAVDAANDRTFAGLTGELAGISSAGTNAFLMSKFAAAGPLRVGGKFNGINWVWENGNPFGFSNWAPGEPSGGTEDSLIFNADGSGRWNDLGSASNDPSGFLVEYVSSPAALQLNVDLADFENDAAEPVSVKFYWNGELVRTETVTGGTATLSMPLRGNLTALIESSHWLDRVVNFSMNGDPEVITVTLINGDADGDNEIGSSDLSIVSTGFLSTTGDLNYVANADFDGDGEIGSSDLSILSANFLASGDSL